MNRFKVGDRVYHVGSNKIHTIESHPHLTGFILVNNTTVDEYGRVLSFAGKNGLLTGPHVPPDRTPVIVPCTEENHALLEKLYGVELEAPPKQKEPKEVIQAMLDDGWEYVPCKTEITHNFPSGVEWVETPDYVLFIENGMFVCEHGTYDDVEPFDPKTGKVIIDYVDGKPVLE